MTIHTYDPTQLSVVFGGVPISGFAEDSMLTIEHENPQYKITTDIHGNVTRTKVNKDTTKITVNLTRGSRGNNILSDFLEADRLNSSGIFSIMIKEATGTTCFACTHAFVLQRPKIEYGAEDKNIEWTLQASGISHYVGN